MIHPAPMCMGEERDDKNQKSHTNPLQILAHRRQRVRDEEKINVYQPISTYQKPDQILQGYLKEK